MSADAKNEQAIGIVRNMLDDAGRAGVLKSLLAAAVKQQNCFPPNSLWPWSLILRKAGAKHVEGLPDDVFYSTEAAEELRLELVKKASAARKAKSRSKKQPNTTTDGRLEVEATQIILETKNGTLEFQGRIKVILVFMAAFTGAVVWWYNPWIDKILQGIHL